MLKALFGWLCGRRPAPPVGPAARAPASPPPAVPATPTQDDAGFRKLNRDAPLRAGQPAEAPAGEPATFLCREAILGRNQRIAGYQFMLQEGARARIRHSTRRVHHLYAEVLVRSLASADIGELLGHRVAFIDVPDSFLADPSLARLPARNVVLVPTLHADPGAPEPDALRHTVEQLRQRGFRIGLLDPTVMTEFTHLLPQADFIVVQAGGLDARRGLQLSNIALEIAPNARLVVRELPSIEEFRFCYKLGATLFQGPFVTSREDWRERELPRERSRDVHEHIERVLGHVRRLESSIESAVQMHFSAVGQRTNDIMRTLTVLTAIFLPLNLITGIFGMNFDALPLIHDATGFWIALLLMAGIGGGLGALFWRKRYLGTRH